MNRRSHSSLIRIIAGIGFLLISYFAFFGEQPLTIVDKDGKLGVYDLTLWFRVVSVLALLISALLVVDGIRKWLTPPPLQTQSSAGFLGFSRLLEDGPGWLIFNLAEIAFAAYAGFRMAASSDPDGTDPSGFLCISILIVFAVFVIGVVSQASGRLRMPSLNRFSLGWNRDPLQALFVTTLSTTALLVGGFCRAGIRALWTLAAFVSLLAGLLIGQAIVYRAFRGEIQKRP